MWAPPPDDEPELLQDVRRALSSGEPIDLLAQVSGLLNSVDPRGYGFGRRPGAPPYSLRDMVDMFLDVPRVETSAVLAVIAELVPDDLQAVRIRRELHRRLDPLPRWLAQLGDADVHEAVEMVHVLGDGDNVNLGVRLAGGYELTTVVYIDHNVGTLVKDAFVVAETIEGLRSLMRTKLDDPDTVWRPLGLADARVRITDAIERAAITVPSFETDTWPVCRPFVEWLTRRMPEGGPATSDRSGASPISAPSPTASSRRRTGVAWTTPITAPCWGPSCGSGPTTAPATRCDGAPWRSSSSSRIGSHGSWSSRPATSRRHRRCSGRSCASAMPSEASGPN